MKRVASGDPLDCQAHAFKSAMFFDRFAGVFGASGIEAAAVA
jgi:hypothetical protein